VDASRSESGGKEMPTMLLHMILGGVMVGTSKETSEKQIPPAGIGETRCKVTADKQVAGEHTGTELHGGDVGTRCRTNRAMLLANWMHGNRLASVCVF